MVMSCGDLYLKGKLYLCRGLLVASQAAEGQCISSVLRSGFRYSSCVSGCWGKTERLECRIRSWVPWFDVCLRRWKGGQIERELANCQILQFPHYVIIHYIYTQRCLRIT